MQKKDLSEEDFSLIWPCLLLAWREIAGESVPPPNKPIEKVIRILSRYVAADLLRKQKKLPPNFLSSELPKIEEEIVDIYSAIRAVGFSSRSYKSAEDYQKAALKRFGDSKEGYQFIKKCYLTDIRIYCFRIGHEKNDFEMALLQKVIGDKFKINFGRQTLYHLTRKVKPT